MAPPNSIVIIPARGGSQRIPGKNSRELAGVPVIARTIAIARASGDSGAIYVSTDSPSIADLALANGAHVIERPADLADHHTPLLPVIQHAIAHLGETGEIAASTTIGCLYATAVTLDPSDFGAGRTTLAEHPPTFDGFVIGVSEYSHPIQRALALGPDSHLVAISPEFAQTRTQDLPSRYFDAGAFIWGYPSAWASAEPILTRSLGCVLPAWRSVDLDTENDWARAELVIRLLEQQ
jgi:pseudaminic acid cytidylyltransferase